MLLRALAVFERVIHHCIAVTIDDPAHPRLEVDAILRAGDAEGPLLLPTPTFMALLGGRDNADDALRVLAAAGRIVEHQEISHIRFPVWDVLDEQPGDLG